MNSNLSAFRRDVKPLNKITWEAFNQIAKLSGDVDHEPSTPKSGNRTSEDDIDWIVIKINITYFTIFNL